nr:hypothetical protein [Tanacetum cinerariifolium]
LGYNTQVFTSSMFDCDEIFTSETDESLPPSPKYDRYHSGDGYHAVPSPYTGTFMPPNPDLVFHNVPMPSAPIIEDWVSDSEDDSKAELLQNTPDHHSKSKSHGNSRNRKACFACKSLTHLIKDCDYYEKKMAQTPVRNHAQRGNHQQYARMTLPNPQRHVVPTAVLTKSKFVPITDARPVIAAVPKPHVTRLRPAKHIVTKPHSPQYARMTLPNPQRHVVPTAVLTKSKFVPITDARPVIAAVPKPHVTRLRPAKHIVTKPHSPPRRHINRSPSPKASNFSLKVTAVKVP